MTKNTIIAILLSTLVVIVSLILQPNLLKNTANRENISENSISKNIEGQDVINENKSFVSEISEISEKEDLKEQQFKIETSKAEIILTNKGGDIISYKLKDHIDVDTKDGIQIVDNVSDINRACALSFNDADAPIVNNLFDVKKENEYTYLFTKTYRVEKDEKNYQFVIGKKYTFDNDEYMFKLEILFHTIEGDSEDFFYTLRTAPQIGPHFNPKLNRYENRQFISFNGSKAEKKVLGQRQFKVYEKDFVWNGIAGKYFTELIIPQNPQNIRFTNYSSLVETNDYSNAQSILVTESFNKKDFSDVYYLYFGPRNEKELKKYNIAEHNNWNLSGLKLTECLNSNGWLGWLETILKWIMEVINKFVHNWGVSIIIMTILIKLLMFPFTKKQSMGTLKMQEIQPKVQVIQSKYQNNPQKMQEEMAKLYKSADYNPMSGCLPMIVQFLILFAMYNLFNNYFEFRGSSFIPHWIDDLSSGDSIYSFNFNIPFFGNQLRILPFIYLASQLLFGKITGNGGTTAPGSTQAQMKMMMYGMPIMFFVLFYNAPSGLLLYWTVSNIFQMGQQIIINNTMKQKRAEMALKNKK